MVTDAMLPLLRRSPAARIVNVSSRVGSLHNMTDPAHYMSRLSGAAYPTSKTALNALSVQYAKALAADHIPVNAVAPGPCATDFTTNLPYPITRTAAQGAEIAVTPGHHRPARPHRRLLRRGRPGALVITGSRDEPGSAAGHSRGDLLGRCGLGRDLGPRLSLGHGRSGRRCLRGP
jgi:NAD(P)-dependent dehydrogenase (short-subunit alcohol dehydrogenase family)